MSANFIEVVDQSLSYLNYIIVPYLMWSVCKMLLIKLKLAYAPGEWEFICRTKTLISEMCKCRLAIHSIDEDIKTLQEHREAALNDIKSSGINYDLYADETNEPVEAMNKLKYDFYFIRSFDKFMAKYGVERKLIEMKLNALEAEYKIAKEQTKVLCAKYGVKCREQ